jgi:hypothetical protein
LVQNVPAVTGSPRLPTRIKDSHRIAVQTNHCGACAAGGYSRSGPVGNREVQLHARARTQPAGSRSQPPRSGLGRAAAHPTSRYQMAPRHPRYRQEHLVSQALRNILGSMLRLFRRSNPALKIIFATPANRTSSVSSPLPFLRP